MIVTCKHRLTTCQYTTIFMMIIFQHVYGGIKNNGGVISTTSGSHLKISGFYQHASNGKMINDGTIHLNGDWINNDAYTGEEHINSVGTLNITGISTLSGTATKECFENISISSGASFTINPGITCHIYGSFSRSDATAQLILDNNSTSHGSLYSETELTDTISINLFLKGNQWSFVTIPFSGYTPTTLLNSELNLSLGIAYFDENKRATTMENWSWCGTNDSLNPGQGYIIWSNNDTTINIKGMLQQNRTINLDYSNTDNGFWHNGWNLVGNYNTTPIDIYKTSSADRPIRTNVDAAIYVYNRESDDYWTFVDGVGVNLPPDGSKIAPYQAYFMKSNDISATVNFSAAQCVIDNSIVLRSATLADEIIQISVIDQSGEGQTLIRYKEDATNSFDPNYDAYQINTTNNHPLIYSYTNDLKFSVNTLPIAHTEAIPLSIQINSSDTFRIAWNIIDVDIYYDLYLLDKKDNFIYDIDNKSDTLCFISSSKLMSDRFMLVRRSNKVTLHNQKKAVPLTITQNENKISVESQEVIKGISIYSLDGKLLNKISQLSNSYSIPINDYRGIVFVSIVFNDQTVTYKQVVR